MSVVRQDLTTKDWTIFAVDKSKRPGAFKKVKENKVVISVLCFFIIFNDIMAKY
ncbi:MAG: hypothetical protein KJ821_06870 [Actinobacteria bacterium]|nr:hypothetical protein [Actinomycetota bacterium]MBU4482634.1 hypothetical protein [Actinomycetota bacterium]MCG2790362.1 hypothetical protein [Actinomycetes bacterium]